VVQVRQREKERKREPERKRCRRPRTKFPCSRKRCRVQVVFQPETQRNLQRAPVKSVISSEMQ